jgi:hypothetical protein
MCSKLYIPPPDPEWGRGGPMPLTAEENDLLTTMLQTLEAELKTLQSKERLFVEDQINRHQTYGDGIRLSPKQRQWLSDIYNRVSGQNVAL